jgi:hypothetical protein
MQLSPLAMAALALVGAGIVLSLFEILRTTGPSSRGIALVGVSLAVTWFAVAGSAWIGLLPPIWIGLATAVWATFLMFGHYLGPIRTWFGRRQRLARAFGRIAADVRRGGLSRDEVERVTLRAAGLDRYRDDATSAWIDLVQAEIRDWAAGAPPISARRKKILEQGDKLFEYRANAERETLT